MAGGEGYSVFEKTVSVNTGVATVYRHLRRIGGVAINVQRWRRTRFCVIS